MKINDFLKTHKGCILTGARDEKLDIFANAIGVVDIEETGGKLTSCYKVENNITLLWSFKGQCYKNISSERLGEFNIKIIGS